MALPAPPVAQRRARPGLGRGGRPERLDDGRHLGQAALHQRPDAVRGSAARDPRGQPDRHLRARVRGPRGMGGPARRPPRRSRRKRPAGEPQRRRVRRRQGLTPRIRVRPDRAPPTGREHADPARREVVRRDLRRGPGPVVARRDHPLGLPVRDARCLPRRCPGRCRSRRRPDDRHARPGRHARVPGARAPARLEHRGPPRRHRGRAQHRGGADRSADAPRLDPGRPAAHVPGRCRIAPR